jgi:Dockerin type I domain
MTERMEHFDEDLDRRASSKLSADLSALFGPRRAVPPEVDRAILDSARRRFVRREVVNRGRRRFRLVGIWKVAAVAAIIILAFGLDLAERARSRKSNSAVAKAQAVDIDHNGRVDILDAFALERHIESGGPANKKWDINGDGLVDRRDVDMVAFAAVRLDKGV